MNHYQCMAHYPRHAAHDTQNHYRCMASTPPATRIRRHTFQTRFPRHAVHETLPMHGTLSATCSRRHTVQTRFPRRAVHDPLETLSETPSSAFATRATPYCGTLLETSKSLAAMDTPPGDAPRTKRLLVTRSHDRHPPKAYPHRTTPELPNHGRPPQQASQNDAHTPTTPFFSPPQPPCTASDTIYLDMQLTNPDLLPDQKKP